MQILVIWISLSFFPIASLYGQSMVQVHYKEKITYGILPMSDLGYMYVEEPIGCEYVSDIFIKINELKSDTLYISIPNLKDSIEYITRLFPFIYGIETRIQSMNDSCYMTNYISSTNAYYQGVMFDENSQNLSLIVILHPKDLPKKMKGKVFKVALYSHDKRKSITIPNKSSSKKNRKKQRKKRDKSRRKKN